MKNLVFKSFLVFLCLCLLLSVVGCGDDKTSTTQEEDILSLENLNTGIEYLSGGNNLGMDLVAENDQLQLLLDPATATIGAYVKATKYLWKSNLDEKTASVIINDDVKSEYMSQLLISYYNASGSEVVYDSYRYGILQDTVDYFGLENGVRVVYQIGQNIDDFFMPTILTEEWMEKLTANMDEMDKEMFMMYYEPLVYEEVSEELLNGFKLTYKSFEPGVTLYQLSTSSKVVKADCYNTYLKPQNVDYDTIDQIYTAAGYSYKKPDTPRFTVAVDYTLTENGLRVNVPVDQIRYEEGSFRLYKIRVLPYFGAVTDNAAAEMIIPDGSGALIDCAHDTKASISLPFYGADNSVWTVETAENMQQATLPVYGLTRGENAFVAYVSDGESIGSVECHPKNSVYPFANVGGTYIVHPFETFASNGASTKVTMQKYASDPYAGNITTEYMFVSGKKVGYVDLAKTVRTYLFAQKEKVQNTSLGFYLDTYGTVMRKENFLGYAYNKDIALTSVEQAQQMYNTLNEKGITNISVRYNNLFNDKYVNKISNIGDMESVVGSKKELTTFMKDVAAKGGIVYPNLELLLEKNSSNLSDATWHSKYIEGTMIKFSASALYSEGVTADFDHIIVKSDEIVKQFPGILEDMKDYENNALSFTSIGKYLFSDFTEDEVKYRDFVQDDIVTVLKTTKEQGNKIMVDMGNAYTLPYADTVIDVPMSGSTLSFEKQEVPFLQIVLHGYVSFAGTPLNLSDDYELQYLKSVEYGADLAYTLNNASAELVKNTNYSELYSTNFDHWIEKASADYLAAAKVLEGCGSSTIEDHVMLAKDVFMTTYENGAQVIVNYTAADYNYNGTVVAPRSFARVGA